MISPKIKAKVLKLFAKIVKFLLFQNFNCAFINFFLSTSRFNFIDYYLIFILLTLLMLI